VIRSSAGANYACMKTPIRLDYVPGARGGPLQEHVLRHLRDMQRLGFKRATLHYDRLLLDDLAGWMERKRQAGDSIGRAAGEV
jgi:hypothetical protein